MSTYFFFCRMDLGGLYRGRDLLGHAAPDQLLRLTDGVEEGLAVGAAMGLDDAAVDAQEGRAAHLGLIHLLFQ